MPNTFGLDATADSVIEYHTEAELEQAIAQGKISDRFLNVGEGSNMLFLGHYGGTVVRSQIKDITEVGRTDDYVELRVGSGMIWDDFVSYCVGHRYFGAENLTAIPGQVGSAAVQNIGAYGVEAKDLIVKTENIVMRKVDASSETFSHETSSSVPLKCTLVNADLQYGYRTSLYKTAPLKNHFITYVTFRLSLRPCYKPDYGTIRQSLEASGLCPDALAADDLPTVRRIITDIRWRKLPRPEELGNAGSFFMNPVVPRAQFLELQSRYPKMPFYEVDGDHVKIPAGWMIEQCGWKGRNLGRAGVYQHQALVLVNLGGATADEVVALSDAVRRDVKREFGIDIYPEVNFIK